MPCAGVSFYYCISWSCQDSQKLQNNASSHYPTTIFALCIYFLQYRISRSISRVFETQNSSQKIDVDLYVTKNIVQVLIICFYFHMFTIFVLSGSVAKLSSSAISGKTKIYLSLINKIKFECVCLFKTCQNSVTTANHV